MSITLATAMARLSGIEVGQTAALRLADLGRAWDASTQLVAVGA